VVVAALTRAVRGLVSEVELTPDIDGVPSTCVINFDNLHTLPKNVFRRQITALSTARMSQACRALQAALGC
jgi:mRNA interferase MazF